MVGDLVGMCVGVIVVGTAVDGAAVGVALTLSDGAVVGDWDWPSVGANVGGNNVVVGRPVGVSLEDGDVVGNGLGGAA